MSQNTPDEQALWNEYIAWIDEINAPLVKINLHQAQSEKNMWKEYAAKEKAYESLPAWKKLFTFGPPSPIGYHHIAALSRSLPLKKPDYDDFRVWCLERGRKEKSND